MKRLLIGLPLILLASLVLAGWWILRTDAGAGWAWSKLVRSETTALSSAGTDGNFADGFRIQGLAYQSADIDMVVGQAELRAEPGWWPLSIHVRELSLRDISVKLHPQARGGENDGEETDISAILSDLKLRLPLIIHEARLTNLNLQEGDQPPVKLVDSLSVAAVLDERLSVSQLDVKGPRFGSGIQGQLALDPPHELTIAANGSINLTDHGSSAEWLVPFTLQSSGNIEQVQFNLVSSENGLILEGELHDLFAVPAWDVSGDLDHLDWPSGEDGEVLTLAGVKLMSRGSMDDWVVELGSRVRHGSMPESRFVLSGMGSVTGIHITNAQLEGPGVNLGVNGRLDWSPEMEAHLTAVISQLDLSSWLVDWPEGERLTGDLELDWSRSGLKIPQGQLSLADADMAVNIEADIDIDANLVDAHLDWSDVRWPLRDPNPDFISRSGGMQVNGNLDQWNSTGGLELKLGDYPGGKLDIEGGGDRGSVRLRILGGDVLGGNISGDAGVDWMNGIRWDANVRAQHVDPEPLLPGWPGRLDLELAIGVDNQAERYELNLTSLRGQLRGVELKGKGGLVFTDDQLSFDQFELSTDGALLWLDGESAGPNGLSVSFDGSLPSMLLQGANGKLQLEARYSSHADQPAIDMQMEALDLSWNGLAVKAVAVETRESGPGAALPEIELNASGLSWQEQAIDELSLSLEPEDEEYRLRAALAGEKLALDTAMSLSPGNKDKPFDGPWHGLLDSMVASFNQEHLLSLIEPASLDWSPGEVRLEPVCLQNEDGAGVCLSGGYQSSGDRSVLVDVKAVPLEYLREILELDVHFDQMIDGQVEWSQLQGRAPGGGAEFRISAGHILEPDDDGVLLKSNEGRFGFVLQNGNLESGGLDIEFPDFGFVDLDFEVLDIMENGARKLTGRAVTQINSIKLFGHLAWPELDDIGGRFESDVLLGGNLTDPDFSGGFRLSDGFIHYTPLGVRLEDIVFEGQVDKRDRGRLNGQFRAGEGIGEISGQFLFEDFEKLNMDLAFSGDRLRLFNTDTVKLNTETDLRFGLSPGRLDINGRIHVPSARFTPENLILGKVTDSEDLVIESRDTVMTPGVEEAGEKTPVFGRLEVVLGDDVFIKVPGVETRASGRVSLDWNGAPIPMANGNFRLNGKLDIYGPTLQINNGSINFPDVPANDPVLNIRAEREIFGNTQIRTAGVQVIGTLQRPRLEAFTVPVTNEDRAWALLVTGSDFDQAQGVAGFDVGTYIAPRLYVSYGVSLFEDENVVSARYDIKKGFGVKVTSGERETGIDMSYTIDRE